jgi:hypothetical protein
VINLENPKIGQAVSNLKSPIINAIIGVVCGEKEVNLLW